MTALSGTIRALSMLLALILTAGEENETDFIPVDETTTTTSVTTGEISSTVTTTGTICSGGNSQDCESEYQNAKNNRQMEVFCARCQTENGANSLQSRCAHCCECDEVSSATVESSFSTVTSTVAEPNASSTTEPNDGQGTTTAFSISSSSSSSVRDEIMTSTTSMVSTADQVLSSVILKGTISMKVSNAQAFVEDPAVKLFMAKSIAEQAQCPYMSWVTVSIAISDTLRRLQMRHLQMSNATVSVLYNINIPVDDDSEVGKKNAQVLASTMSELLAAVEQDAAAFKSTFEAELQLLGIDYAISEVTASEPALTTTWDVEKNEVDKCSSQSLALASAMMLLSVCM